MKNKWKKMDSKEIIKFWNLESMLKEGIDSGYDYSNCKIVNGEMFVLERNGVTEK